MLVQAAGASGRFVITKVIRLGPRYEFRSELFRQYLIEVAGTFR
jgi:hypothetical protein